VAKASSQIAFQHQKDGTPRLIPACLLCGKQNVAKGYFLHASCFYLSEHEKAIDRSDSFFGFYRFAFPTEIERV